MYVDDEHDDEHDDDRGVRRFDEVLRLLFEPIRAKAQGKRRDRIDRCDTDLRRCLDANGQRLLTDSELALLPLERQLDPDGAAGRVASEDVVLLLLPLFLRDQQWHGLDAYGMA